MAVETKTSIGVVPESNSAHSDNGRPNGLSEHAGFIAVKSTFSIDEPLQAVNQQLIDRGVKALTTRMEILREVSSARRQNGEEEMSKVAKEIRKTPEDHGI